MSKKNIKKIVMISLILLLALTIRLYKLDSPFCSNDHATIQMFTIDSIPKDINSLFSIDNYGINNPLRILASIYSITLPAYMFTYLNIYNLINIPITETTLKAPMMIIGLLTLILVYIVSKRFTTSKNSLIITLAIAILPGHIAWSKDISNSLMIALLGQLTSILFFTKYLETNKKKDAMLASIAIAFTFLSDNLFPQFISLLIYIYVVYERKTLFKSIKKIINPYLSLLPILALLMHVIIFITILTLDNSNIGTNAGAIGHILEKQKFIGLNITHFFSGLEKNTSVVIASIVSILTLIGFTKIFTFKKENILLAAGLAYSLPLILFIDPNNIDFTVYSFTGAIYLTMYSLILILKSKINLIKITLLTACISSIIFTATISHINQEQFLGFGKQSIECGSKTAGYYFREYTPKNSTILTISDGLGSGSTGPIIGKYYYNRKIYGLFNHNNDKYIEIIEKEQNNIDYIITKPNTLIENYIKQKGYFVEAIIIYQDNIELLRIYSKNKTDNIMTLNSKTYNTLYEKKYNKISNYINTPNYIADSPPWI